MYLYLAQGYGVNITGRTDNPEFTLLHLKANADETGVIRIQIWKPYEEPIENWWYDIFLKTWKKVH